MYLIGGEAEGFVWLVPDNIFTHYLSEVRVWIGCVVIPILNNSLTVGIGRGRFIEFVCHFKFSEVLLITMFAGSTLRNS